MSHLESTMTRSGMTNLNRRFAGIFTGGKVDRFDDLVAEDFVDHNPAPGHGPGRHGIKDWLHAFRVAFSNLRWEIEDEIPPQRPAWISRPGLSGLDQRVSSARNG